MSTGTAAGRSPRQPDRCRRAGPCERYPSARVPERTARRPMSEGSCGLLASDGDALQDGQTEDEDEVHDAGRGGEAEVEDPERRVVDVDDRVHRRVGRTAGGTTADEERLVEQL